MPEKHVIRPTAVLEPFGPRVSICLFGRPENWSFETNLEAPRKIAEFCLEHGIKKITAPVADFSAVVCPCSVPPDVFMYDFGFLKKVQMLRNSADGAVIYPEEAFYVRSGDCPTLVVFDPDSGLIVCAHAGRECLYDRANLLGKAPRQHKSVVEAALCRFDSNHSRLLAFITCGIKAGNFKHELWVGGVKRTPEVWNMLECLKEVHSDSVDLKTGSISLNGIITAQLIAGGVQPQNIGHDLINTYGDLNEGCPVWWSYRRGDKVERNGVLVLNRS